MAKPAKKLKRLLYLRASFVEKDGQKPASLEAYLQKAYETLPNVEQRKVEFAGKTWFGNWYDPRADCFLFQFSAATPGEDATTVPTAGLAVQNIELAAAHAPEGSEFADGDVICCAKGNDVFVCCSHLRYGAVQSYLLALFEAAGCGDQAAGLRVDRPANFDKVRMIKAAGVRSLSLNASLDAAEFQRLEHVKDKGILRKCLHGLIQRDKPLMEAAVKSHSRFKLEISIPKRGDVGGAGWLDTASEEAVGDSWGYRIETKDGKVITPEEITISKSERLEPFGKTVFRAEAVQKLMEFKNEFLNPRKDE